MVAARFSLATPPSSLGDAEMLAEAIEAHVAIDAVAVSINETDEAQNLWTVIAYFESEAAALRTRNLLNSPAAQIAAVPDIDWVRRSLEGLAPVIAGRFFLHGSHDRALRRSGGHSLEIDAGTAFGTGHHGTTSGCLLALDHILKHRKPRRIFDLGCGTGVLAIAAARASHAKVLATDIDPEAVRVTVANAKLNGLAFLLCAQTAPGLHHPAIRQSAPYDLIFANILARPLASLAQGLTNLVAPGGALVLSGLTRDQLRWIRACYTTRGLVTSRIITIENWVALVMQKAKRPPKKPSGRRIVR